MNRAERRRAGNPKHQSELIAKEIIFQVGVGVVKEAAAFGLACRECGRECFQTVPPVAVVTRLPEGKRDLMEVQFICADCARQSG